MKKMFTLIAAVAITAFVYAQPFNSLLNFRLPNNAHFTMHIDGQNVNGISTLASNNSIRPGRHQVRISVPVYNHIGSRKMQTIFLGWVNIAPGRVLYATLDRFNNFFVEQTFALQHKHGGWNHPTNNHNNTWNNCVEYNDYDEYSYPNNHYQPTTFEPQQQVIDAVTFQQLKETINKTSFESTKENVLNQAKGNFWFTTHQVKEIIGLFSFESTKLEVAKSMYNRTVDKQNYFTVSQHFNFNSSVQDLTQYLAQR
jgi:hypothetical protein